MTEHADRYWDFWRSLIAEIGHVRPALGNQLTPSKKAGIRLEYSPKPSATYRLWWSGRTRAKRLRAEFFVRGNRELYRSLTEHRFEIEEAFGGQLEWEPMVGEKGMRDGGNTYSRIVAYHGSTYELRELAAAEALCPWILETLDRLKYAINPILLGHKPSVSLSGDEAGVQILEGQAMPEGAITHAEVLRFERSAAARAACLQHFGHRCQVCDLDFEERYGELGRGFMHVHHVVSLHKVAGIPNYRVDPIEDLRPVCPNCHATLTNPDHKQGDRPTGPTTGYPSLRLSPRPFVHSSLEPGYSVALGWPVLATVNQTVRWSSSMQYQMRPPDVTSYCHCSISTPFIERRASCPWSGF